MYKNFKAISIIGARSGSIGIKHKNVKKLNNRPLLYWIIKTALKSKYLDRVLVSTDSAYYQKLSIKYGAETPFLRPKKISRSKSGEIDYIIHALDWLKKNEDYTPDIIVRLQPTSPFQCAKDIDISIMKLADDKKATSAQVVAESDFHPYKALKISRSGYLKPFITKNNNVINRQNLVKSYHRANIISTKSKFFLKNKKDHIGNFSIKIEIPTLRAIDINNKKDFKIADCINKIYKFLK
jgi:CMP-N-acetylneuraminic acid synthetase